MAENETSTTTCGVMKIPNVSDMDIQRVTQAIPTYADWPKQGILFYDTSALLGYPEIMKIITAALAKRIQDSGATHVLLPEARGYIFGCAPAIAAGVPIVLARKANKLPGALETVEYDLEYGKSVIQIKKGTIPPGSKVFIIDDLLATGGTVQALTKLVECLGSKVIQANFIVHLKDLSGQEKLPGIQVETFISF